LLAPGELHHVLTTLQLTKGALLLSHALEAVQRDAYYYSFAQATAPSALEGKTSRLRRGLAVASGRHATPQ
jgi:hypothetical protein